MNSITDFGITGYPNGFPMSRLKKLKKLKLYINPENITDASIKHIESMANLSSVFICKSKTMEAFTNPIFLESFW